MDSLEDAGIMDAMAMMDEHDHHHDSQMITQEISDDDGEDNTQGNGSQLCVSV